MQISLTQILIDIANNNPLLFVIIAIFVVLIPKTYDYLISSKKLYTNSENELMENFAKRLTKIQDRCDELQAELDNWKDKYYKLAQHLTKLEVENKLLIDEIKKSKGKD